MPVDIGADFLAVDEIQLCGDPDRGHIFTDRLLNARGQQETLFLGAETMRRRIASLVPGAHDPHARAFSGARLHRRAKKLSRMPPRSAIVGFSVEDVYAIAELIRRQNGGAAVVMGALSPRTRNAQVALYQNGDVDHLVATDAIGMGLNLDIAHVAFSGLVKFDGRRHRHLRRRAGADRRPRRALHHRRHLRRHRRGAPLEPEVVEAIENHRFRRSPGCSGATPPLDFGTPSAGREPRGAGRPPDLQRAREADDLATLKELAVRTCAELRGACAAVHPAALGRLPDPRLPQGDARRARQPLRAALPLPARRRGIPTDWLARQIARIDRTDGDIDALSKRLAYIRTWTYVAQRRPGSTTRTIGATRPVR